MYIQSVYILSPQLLGLVLHYYIAYGGDEDDPSNIENVTLDFTNNTFQIIKRSSFSVKVGYSGDATFWSTVTLKGSVRVLSSTESSAVLECTINSRDVLPCTDGITVQDQYETCASSSIQRFTDTFEVQLSGDEWSTAKHVGFPWCNWNKM